MRFADIFLSVNRMKK